MESAPDIEEELNTPFKRRVTLAVTVVALLAGIMGFAASDAGARESQTARDAAIAAVLALSSQNAASADSYEQFGDYVNASMVKRRHDMDVVGGQLLGQDAAVGTSQDWRRASDQLSDLTGLLRPGELADRPDLLWNSLFVAPNVAQLQQAATQETASSWGEKSNLYVGAVTLLAIAVTLLGLSLTVGARLRRIFIGPAALLVAVTILGSGVVAIYPPATTPRAALESVAEGDRLAGGRDYEGALAAYDRAIELDGDYATAYARRASATLLAGSPERATSVYVISTTSREARTAAASDYTRALELGGEDYTILVNMGGNYFHLGEYENTENYSRRAIEANPTLALPWMNLGLALVAQDRPDEARATYARAIELIAQRPTWQERRELYAAARGTLAAAASQVAGRDELINELQAEFVRAEGAALLTDGVDAPGATASALRLSATASALRAEFDYANLPRGARVAWIVYHRGAADQQWVQRGDMSPYESWALADAGAANRSIFDFSCPSAGEYRLDLYAGGRRLATGTTTHAGSSLKLRQYGDSIGGINLCRPGDWSVGGPLADGDPLTGGVTIASADRRSTLTVRTVPVLAAPATAQEGEQLLSAVLDRLEDELPAGAIGTGEARHSYLYSLEGPVREFELPNAQAAYLWAGVGADGVLRTVSAVYPTSALADINDLLPRIAFY